MPADDLGPIELRDEAEWLHCCGAPYEIAVVQPDGCADPIRILFEPTTGRAGVAQRDRVRWLCATSVADAAARYLRGEGQLLM